jgi:cytochrome c biogenesis protein CcmG, thiol:disulfide interchange protein DsbE
MLRVLVATAVAALGAVAACAAAAADLKPWNGGPTPELELQDLAGKEHRLADYRGSVVLVNFWATWCVPCREEMPSIDRLRSSLKGKPFEVLAVNLAEPLSRIEKFVAAMPLGFPLLRDRDGTVSKAWKAKLLPASFLIGRDGRIRYVAYGELDWSSDAVRARVAELLD